MIEVRETRPRQYNYEIAYDVFVDGKHVSRHRRRQTADTAVMTLRKWGVTTGRNPDPACPPEAPSQYCVFTDGYMVAGFPTLKQAEAYAKQLRKEQGDDTPNPTTAP